MDTRKRKFAFLIHPRDVMDLYRRLGAMVGIGERLGMKYLPKILPKSISEKTLQFLKGRAGFTVCSKFTVNEEVEGYIIAVLLTGRQMVSLDPSLVSGRVMDSIIFAQDELGVERVGLGAYTAPFTGNGIVAVRDKRVKCRITHGDALSAASSVEAVKQLIQLRDLNIGDLVVAVVGAYGVVGRASSILLSELGPQKMILTGPKKVKLERVKKEIKNGEVEISDNNDVIKEADVVILSTTATGDIIQPRMLKENAIVVDMAQPHNMAKEVCFKRPDVIRVDGGYLSLPARIKLGFEMGPPPSVTFACLCETTVSMLIGDREHHVGPVDIAFAREIYGKAQRQGFSLAPFTNFSKPIGMMSSRPLKKIKESLAPA